MSKTLIEFYYQLGVYDVDKMIQLVKEKEISEQEFFEITRLHYKVLKKKKETRASV